MTTRRRTTWTQNRKAAAPPATPGYAEGTDHPAYQPDPNADKYMNGDPSSWAEDPHPGPYPNPAPPPADPGMQEPQGHPATDPAHYFPGGAKAASRSLRAAMEHKASKCIRIATAMLGRKASVDMVEDQALDLMNLSDRQIQAMLGRIGGAEGPEANYTLTPERSADGDLLADDMMVEEEDVAVPVEAAKKAKKGEDEEVEEVEEVEAAKKAAHYSRLASYWKGVSKKAADEDEEEEEEPKKEAARRATPGGQNDPATYETVTAGEDDDEEAMLAAMLDEEAKKQAKKSEKEPFGGKKAPPFGKKDDEEKKEAKKSEDEDEGEGDEKKASVEEMMLAEMLGDEPVVMADDFGDDPMSLMDDPMDSLSDDEMAVVYGGKYAGKKAKKSEDEGDEEEEEKKSEDEEEEEEEEKKEAKKAALKPQPRLASSGPKTLGSVANGRTASNEISDLSKLWESAPDVSKVFG